MRDEEKVVKMLSILNFSDFLGASKILTYFRTCKGEKRLGIC